MKRKKSRLWIVLPLVALVIAGAVYAFLTLREKNNKAFVQPVSDLNNSWILMNGSSYGTITSGTLQQIYLDWNQKVSEVYVAPGTHVEKDTPLFRYDTQQLQLTLQQQQSNVESYSESLYVARQLLEAYKKIVPVAEEPAEPEPYQLTGEQKLPGEHERGNGTPEAPYRFNCTEETIVTGRQINQWILQGLVVSLEVWEGGVMPLDDPEPLTQPTEPADPADPTDPTDPADPTDPTEPEEPEKPSPLFQWIIDGRQFLPVEPDSFWSVTTHEQWFPPEPEDPEPEKITYTENEKARLISEQELKIRRLENELALAQNALAKAQKDIDDTVVRATMSGVVEEIGQPGGAPADGSPFCRIAGSEGVTLTGYVSELALGSARVGDRLSVTSWMSGMTTDAEIVSISPYPADRNEYAYYGDGNPNASYYQFTAHMDSSEGFNPGEEAGIQPYIENVDQIIVLPKVYVRSDARGAYALVDDGAGRLVRRDVTIQGTSDPEYVKVLTGLTLEDMVAFPYGKSGHEGALTTTEYKFSIF